MLSAGLPSSSPKKKQMLQRVAVMRSELEAKIAQIPKLEAKSREIQDKLTEATQSKSADKALKEKKSVLEQSPRLPAEFSETKKTKDNLTEELSVSRQVWIPPKGQPDFGGQAKEMKAKEPVPQQRCLPSSRIRTFWQMMGLTDILQIMSMNCAVRMIRSRARSGGHCVVTIWRCQR